MTHDLHDMGDALLHAEWLQAPGKPKHHLCFHQSTSHGHRALLHGSRVLI
jgi:hypothetical protein